VLVVAVHEPLDRWRTVQIVELEHDDPWRAIYHVLLGQWPQAPDQTLCENSGLREDLRFEDVVPVTRTTTTGSLNDLVERLADREFLSPRAVSTMFLSHGLRPDTSYLGFNDGVLPSPRATRRAAGPNLIVVVTPGSVEDLALLWNLRGAHGGRRVLPVGIPAVEVCADSLRGLEQPGRATMFGLGGGRCHLVSASIPIEELEDMAALGLNTRAVPYEEVLTFGPAPGRVHSHVSAWLEGRTRLNPVSELDRDVLRAATGFGMPQLVLDVTVDNHLLPADGTMRGSELFGRFQAGSAQSPSRSCAGNRRWR
jgi:hypothetical protein